MPGSNSKVYAAKRKLAYDLAYKDADQHLKDPLLRDFVNMYIAEGSKRDCDITVTNSDPDVIKLSITVMYKYFLSSSKEMKVDIKYYANTQDPDLLVAYWTAFIQNKSKIRLKTYIQKTINPVGHNNSNTVGLVAVRIYDIYAHQKLNAYIDYVKSEWHSNFSLNTTIK